LERHTKVTFCRICEAGCGLLADVENGRVAKLRPDPDHVVSRGYACVKGIRYTEVHASPDRLTTPLKRVGSELQPISWEQALAEIGAKVRALREAHGDQSIAMYVGNPAAFSLPHPLFAQLFLASLGSRNMYTSGSQDCNNKFVVSDAMYGSALIQPVPDVDHTECLIVLGANPAVSHMSFLQLPRPVERLKAIEKRGGALVFVNPRRTESAEQVGEQVFIRPNTDVFFLLSFACELIRLGAVHVPALAHTEGFDALEALVLRWPAERSAPITGIDAETTRALVARYAAANGAALYCSTGVNQGSHGTLACWLLQAINVISGNVDRVGGLLVPRAQVRNARTVQRMSRGVPVIPSRIGGFQPVLGSYPAGILADEIETEGDGQVRALFVTAGNPILSCPDSARMRRALDALELVVSIDLFRNETGNLAHYVLPVTSFLERDDLPLSVQGFQPVPYLQHGQAVVSPVAETRDEWWIFSRLAAACGARLMNSRLLQAWLNASTREPSSLPGFMRFSPRLMFQAVALGSATTLGRLENHPHGKLLPAERSGRFLGRQVLRPKRRVHVAPAAYVEAAQRLEAIDHAPSLLLIPQREKTSHNSWMHNVDAFVRGPRATNYLTMHPRDAEARGLPQGARVCVASATGKLVVPLRISDEVMQGVVALPHGWGHGEAEGLSVARRTLGQNANLLTPSGPAALERFSGMAQLTAIPVEVTAFLTHTDLHPTLDGCTPHAC
jgi:anaerobic selenocysteine-containing dehydrogenase